MAKLPSMMDIADSLSLELLRRKLASSHGISYARVAREAHTRGRTRLAKKLLEFEPRSSAQVSLLNFVGDYKHALAKAIESGDADLIYLSIFQLQRHLSFQDLSSLLSSFSQAKALFAAFCKRTDNEMLKSLHYSSGDTTQGAQVLLLEALSKCNSVAKADRDSSFVQLCGQASASYGRGTDHFHAKALEETQRLFHAKVIESNPTSSSPFLPLASLVHQLITGGNTSAAQKLRSSYNMDERHFYHVKVAALGSKRDWTGLENFMASKRPPIGYLPFVEICQQHGAPPSVISRFIGIGEAASTATRFPFFNVSSQG